MKIDVNIVDEFAQKFGKAAAFVFSEGLFLERTLSIWLISFYVWRTDSNSILTRWKFFLRSISD